MIKNVPHSNAPSHGWLISNKLLRYIAWLAILIALILTIAISSVTYAIRRDCTQPYNRTLHIGSYWLTLTSGSLKDGCPDEHAQ